MESDRFTHHAEKDIDFFRSRIDVPHIHHRTQNLFDIIFQNQPRSVLEAGCGEGIALVYKDPEQYVGVDTSLVRLKFASIIFKGHTFIQGDGTCLPFRTGQFELVFCNGTLHHLSRHGIFLMIKEMARVCQKGGWVAVIEPNAYNPASFLMALLRKPERGILNCRLEALLNFFKACGLEGETKIKYDGTFSPLHVFTYMFFRRLNFIRAPWFNRLWERIDAAVNRLVPERFWTNIVIMVRK